jgi:UDP-3-O-[3-hydroxymyristoyl] glucosamine N-acyltransferase
VTVEPGARVDGAILATNVRVGRGAYVAAGTVAGHDVCIQADTIVPPHSRIRGERAVVNT